MLTSEIFINKSMSSFDNKILKIKKFNMDDTIVLVGSPRSGTTWLMELFETIPGYTHLFEPLNHEWFPELLEVGFKSRSYLTKNSNWPQGEKHMEKILTGDISSIFPQYRLELKEIMHRLLGNKLIIKLVRGNRLLPWLAEKFQLRGIVFIIRHPCAVIASQLKTGICGYNSTVPPYPDIFPNLERILDEAAKIDGVNYGLLRKLGGAKTREEVLAINWCLDNYVPLSSTKPHPWKTLTYERLVIDGKKEIIRLFKEIGVKNIPEAAFHHLKIPSTLAPQKEHEIVVNSDQQLTKWKKILSKKQIENILNVVSEFGLGFYSEDPEPDYNNIDIRR